MLQLMWDQPKASRWRNTDICVLLWWHPRGQQAPILKFSLWFMLTCCRQQKWQENSSRLSAVANVCCQCVCPGFKAWDVVALTPPQHTSPVVVAPVRTPWPSHRHAGSKHGPLTPPSCLCMCVCVSLALTYLSKHALLAEHSSTLVIQG